MTESINKIKTLLQDCNINKIEDFLNILTKIELNDDSKLSGLLYYCLKLNKLSMEQIEKDYPNHAHAVQVLDKLDHINYNQQNEEAENIRKMFFAITKDIRIIMIKLSFVTAELRYPENISDKQSLSNSIFVLFAPLSARLGLNEIKTELENGAFKLSNPTLYNEIQQEVDNRFHKRQPIVERLTTLVQNCLKELNITGRVYGRKKHIYSIYKKIQSKGIDNIYDLIAVRAIVKTVPECYALIGKLNSILEPYKNRYKDYISHPKANGYQSIHTTVIFEGFPVEIQIRTEEMHQYAEYGIAAHWLYKEKRTKQDNLDIRLSWLRQMMESDTTSIEELALSLNQDLYANTIFVQSPKGKVIYLPTGATPIDFAYSIHSEIGNKCVGAKVNNKIVPLSSCLQNGDMVEIITNPNSKGPSRDWLKICKSNEARKAINNYFKKNMRDETIKLGKSILENAIKEKGFSVNKLTNFDGFNEIVSSYNYSNLDDFYLNIGTNSISAKIIATKLAQQYKKSLQNSITNQPKETRISLSAPTEKQIKLEGLNNILIKFAGCCHPMYGDDIIGFISTGRGVIIHRTVCPNVSCFSTSRLINACWKPIEEKQKNTKTKNK